MGGTDTSDATAISGDILLGKTAYVGGEKVEGSIETYANEYEDGTGAIFIPDNIKLVSSSSDIISSETNKLCILNESNHLDYKVCSKINGESGKIFTLNKVLGQTLMDSCCATYGNYIYIFGGHNGTSYSNIIYKFNSINETIEQLSVRLPQALDSACCSIYQDKIYIFGGGNGSSYLNTIYKFNCTTETISRLNTTLPEKLGYACCASRGSSIYIFGGDNGTSVNTIYHFYCSDEIIELMKLSKLPYRLKNACCATCGDDIYIFGGFSENKFSNLIYKFNNMGDITTLSTTLPKKMLYSCCAVYAYKTGTHGNCYTCHQLCDAFGNTISRKSICRRNINNANNDTHHCTHETKVEGNWLLSSNTLLIRITITFHNIFHDVEVTCGSFVLLKVHVKRVFNLQ